MINSFTNLPMQTKAADQTDLTNGSSYLISLKAVDVELIA